MAVSRPGMLPRVDDCDAASREIVDVAGGHDSPVRTGDGGNLAIELADGSSCGTP
ncbi:hypothetical protein ThimaDRAFT_4918, partial [Thiocapsa marina 5811]